MPVAANHSAEVAAAIFPRLLYRGPKRANPHQLVIESQIGPLHRPLFRPRHVLPSPVRQEAVIGARDQLGAIFEHDPVGRLARHPVSPHLRDLVATIRTTANGPVDTVSDT